jgi:error-prone DNA polymerase
MDAQGLDALRPVRLGLGRISGLEQEAGQRIVVARQARWDAAAKRRASAGGIVAIVDGADVADVADGVEVRRAFTSPEDLARRAQLDAHQLTLLAQADALLNLSGHRHQGLVAVAGVDTRATALLAGTRTHEEAIELQAPAAGQTVLADYRATGLSLSQHPVGLLREQLAAFKVEPAIVLNAYPDGRLARASGIVTHRQRPETAKGVVFVTLEDETGAVNVIVWPQVAEAQRRPLLASSLLTVYGIWQCQGAVRHLIARRLVDHSELLQGLAPRSRNFR